MDKSTCVISFLGTSSYKPTQYKWGQKGRETRFIALALAEFFEAQKVVILATEEAQSTHRQEMERCFHEAGKTSPHFVNLPKISDEKGWWEHFNIIKNTLREHQKSRIVFDITHGFRAQPFFAAGVLLFVHMVDDADYDIQVVYGALEGEEASLWDLTPFVELIRWSEALSLFLKTGNAHLAAEPMEQFGRQIRRSKHERGVPPGLLPKLDELAKALRDFGDDISTVRTGSLLLGKERSSAQRLCKKISESRQDVESYFPPVADVLNRVKEMIRPLCLPGDYLNTREGHQALSALAQRYYDWRRYTEAAITLREGWITRYAENAAACPGSSSFDKQARNRAEEIWRRNKGEDNPVSQLRNDLQHGGYKADPTKAEKLIKSLEKLIKKFKEIEFSPPVFLNLSNHPSSAWSNDQREAARRYAPELVDLEFPHVSPLWGEEDIKRCAEELLGQIPPLTTHAMVVGEPSLTMELVRRLQERGVVCLTATTERDVTYEGDQKTSRFRFVQFRPYPNLSQRVQAPEL